jgi:hypothetical protein
MIDRLAPLVRGPGSRVAALCLLLAACMPGERVAVPADGELRLTTAQTSLAVTVPPAVRDSVRYLGNGVYYFGSGEGAEHTIVGSVTGEVVAPARLADFRAAAAGQTDAAILDGYLLEMMPMERASPGRPTNRLVTYEMRGDGQPVHLAQGLACNERGLVAEDRDVPGEGGALFHYHAVYYTCIDPRTRFPVELLWSERYRAAADQLSDSFESDATRFFSSLRFL